MLFKNNFSTNDRWQFKILNNVFKTRIVLQDFMKLFAYGFLYNILSKIKTNEKKLYDSK